MAINNLTVEPQPTTQYNSDPNSNLREAVFQGNEQNTLALNQFAGTANQLTNQYNNRSGNLAKGANQDMSNAYGQYADKARGLLGAMGTADQDMHARHKANAYAGLDSGFANAGNDLQASLAQRGLSGSGIFARSMGDLSQDRMRAGSETGVRAYGDAINASDARRNAQLSGEGNLYGAQQNTLLGNYGRSSGILGQQYGTNMAVQGQNLQNTLNNTQQRQANLMGYAQLGRGMSGMAANYLGQAGTGYGAIGGQAGQTAIGLGSNAVSYNTGMNSAQSKNNSTNSAKGADMFGTAAGMAFSDRELKEQLIPIMDIAEGITLYRWIWSDDALPLVGNAPSVGVVAQEIQKVMPEAVHLDEESGYLQVNYSMIFKG